MWYAIIESYWMKSLWFSDAALSIYEEKGLECASVSPTAFLSEIKAKTCLQFTFLCLDVSVLKV